MKLLTCSWAMLLLSAAVVAAEPDTLYRNGVEAFHRGDIEASCAAFDALVEARPADKPRLWQRGISLYYARRLEACVDQFESHREANPHDAENSVWHYLCLAALEGAEAARARFIPARDPRIPMMAVHRLFAGGATPDEVFARVAPGNRTQAFYAHLYVGLWHESRGEARQAREQLGLALDGPPVGHYMESVARVHLARIESGRHWAAPKKGRSAGQP